MTSGFFHELRRRRVYQTVALYVIGAWLVIQVADVLFPAWDIPDTAKQYLVIGAILGFPIALVFGWRYDITTSGIRRTPTSSSGAADSLPLTKSDAGALSLLGIASAGILYWMASQVSDLAIAPQLADAPDIREDSIAVLPFINISNDPSNESFCDGISEEMLSKLGEFRDLHVLGRASSFPFKGSDLGIRSISKILGVRYLLQGSVRKESNQLRISAQLLDNSGFQVWEKNYDRELTSIFAVQQEIAAAVATSLAEQITSAPIRRRDYTPDIDAYEYFLLGREHVRRRQGDWRRKSIELYEKAIAIDPEYPQPYAGLAVSNMIGLSGLRQADRLVEIQSLVDRALELNPELPEAHAAQGLLETFKRPTDNIAAERSLRKALELDPHTYGARNWLVISLHNQGRHKEGLEERRRALQLDPMDPILNVNVGLNLSSTGDFRGAEKQIKRLIDLPGMEGLVYSNLLNLYEGYGRYVDMLDAAKRVAINQAELSGVPRINHLGRVYGLVGLWDEAEYWQSFEEQVVPGDLGVLFRRAYIHKLRGEYQQMWEYMSRIVREYGMQEDQLPFWAAQIIGAAHAMGGNLDKGIELLEKTLDFSQPLPASLGGGGFAIDFVNVLAWAQQRKGNDERAAEVLQYAVDQFDRWEQADGGRGPQVLVQKSLTHALLGERDASMEAFELAVASGFRDYYMTWNDPRWDVVRDDERFVALMTTIKADVDGMADEILEIDSEDDFESRLTATAAAQRAKTSN